MADEQQIDKIFIDINVKNTGAKVLNTVQENANKLQTDITNINKTAINIKTTAETKQTLNTLDRIVSNINVIRKAMGKTLALNTTLSGGTARNTGGKAKSGSSITTTFKGTQQFSQTIKQVEKDGFAVTKVIDEFGKTVKQTEEYVDRLGNSYKDVFLPMADKGLKSFRNGLSSTLIKITAFGVGLQQTTRLISEFTEYSKAYVENLNLFRVTFGELADEAERYVEAYSTALGLDPSEVMRNMGFFNQIVTGFGVSAEEGYKMSKLLTQLSYDLASFVNIDFDQAILKFQSGISGELEPLRRVGYALDEVTLQQVAYNHGIQKSIRNMSQAEKSYLRLWAIYEQSANVMGDLAGTLDSPANASRVLEQQVILLKRAIGNGLLPIVTKLIPVIQGATMALTEFFNMIAKKMGYEVEGNRENAYADYMNNITESAKEAEDAVNGTLLSFDKFSALQQTNTTKDEFTLPIPEYDALATLTNSLYETNETAQKVYGSLINLLMIKDDKGEWQLSYGLQALAKTLEALHEALKPVWGILVESFFPALTEVLKIFVDIFAWLVKFLDFFDALPVVLGILIGLGILKKLSTFNSVLKVSGVLIKALFNPLGTLKKAFLSLKPILKTVKEALAKFVMYLVGEFGLMSTRAKILSASFSLIGIAAGVAFGSWLDTLDANTRKVVSIIGLLVSVLALGTVAWLAYHGAMTAGVAVPLILTAVSFGVASIYGLFSSAKELQGYATGGFTPETKGSLFMAGENGRPELMGTVKGKNAVANVNSIETAMEQASYRGMISAMSENSRNNNDNRDIVLVIDGKELARANVKNTASALNRNYKVELNPR